MAVLSKDFFAVPEAEIQTIESVLTVVGGKVVYAAAPFADARSAAPAREPGLVARRALRRRCADAAQRPPHGRRARPRGALLGCDCFVG